MHRSDVPPSPDTRARAAQAELLRDAAERSIRYLESLDTRPVGPPAAGIAGLAAFDEALPQRSSDPRETLALLDRAGTPATMGMASGRFFGFVIGGALPVTVATHWLGTALDQNAGLWAPTPMAAKLEEVALRWMLDLFGLPPETGAGFVTGATVANFTALAAARNVVLRRVGWDVEADGLIGAPPVHVIVGEEVHPTVLKSLGMLGLGRKRVQRVPVDGQGRMRADAIPRLDGPTILLLQAGNVNTGAFDPFEAAIARARETNAWVHVDGAFGLWARVSPALRGLAGGLELADSWATDCHKWLNVPYDSGVAFVREADALRAAMAITAEYLPTETPHRNPSDHTPELSRRARGIDVWAALRSLGREGLAEMIERCCRHARTFATELSAAGFEILNDVVLNQVLVSFGSPERTQRIIAAIQQDGTCWCGGTVWQGRTAMRISVCSWATTDADVERSLAAMKRAASATS